MSENQVIDEVSADLETRSKSRRLSQTHPLGDIQESSYGVSAEPGAIEGPVRAKPRRDAACADDAPASARSSSKESVGAKLPEQVVDHGAAAQSTTGSSISMSGESMARRLRDSAASEAAQPPTAVAREPVTRRLSLYEDSGASGMSAQQPTVSAIPTTCALVTTVRAASFASETNAQPLPSPGSGSNPLSLHPSGAASAASSKRPEWSEHDESPHSENEQGKASFRQARSTTGKRLSSGVRTTRGRMHRRHSLASETQSTVLTPTRTASAERHRDEEGAHMVSGLAPSQDYLSKQPVSQTTAAPTQNMTSARNSLRPPMTAMTWSAGVEMNTSAAIRAFEEYRASVSAQLDAAERLVERYKVENEQLRAQLNSAEPAKLRRRLEELERDHAEQQVRSLELENRALQLEAELARERVVLERERLQLSQLENDAAPAAALFQLCSGASHVKPIRVRYESNDEASAAQKSADQVTTPGERVRPQALWLTGYQVLLENSQSQRRALFQLVLDDAGDIEYTPLDLQLGDAATEAPDFLQETIYFPKHELPLFWLRLVSALF
jgi:hypothetical protein